MASAPARLGEGTGRPPPRRAHPSRRRDRGSSEGLAVDPAGIALEDLGLVLGGEEVDALDHRLQIVEVMAPMGIMDRYGDGPLELGRASCRARVCLQVSIQVVDVSFK